MKINAPYMKYLLSAPGIAALIGIVYFIAKYIITMDDPDLDTTQLLKDSILLTVCAAGILMIKPHFDPPNRMKSKIKDVTDKVMGIPDF